MNFYDLIVKDAKENDISMREYKGKVLLIVNTATKCGYTKQYDGLQELYDKYKDRGFEILDFPCNQFAGQAPGSNEEIAAFCSLNFGITFKQFKKINVNGKEESPLYTLLKEKKNGRIRWNFTKFLIDRDGNVVERYDSAITPKELDKEIAAILDK